MRLSKRDIVILLDGLSLSQTDRHQLDNTQPRPHQFTHFNEAVAAATAESGKERELHFEELDNLFSELVKAYHGIAAAENDLASLPPNKYLN